MRHVHLDFLRAILMMYGIVVHSSTLGSGISELYTAIQYSSGLVRMEAFYIISGFVSAVTLAKYGNAKTIEKRLVRIGIPLIFGLIALNPIANYLVYSFHNTAEISFVDFLTKPMPENAKGPMVWHLHLWFLFPLLVYALLLPAFTRILSTGWFNWLHDENQSFSTGKMMLILGVLALIAVLFRLGYTQGICNTLNLEQSFIIREGVYQLPFYFFGIMIYHSRTLYDAFHKPRWVALVISGVALTVLEYLHGSNDSAILKVAYLFTLAFTAFSLSNILFYIAKNYLSGNKEIVRFYSDASYTVYMLHYLTIYVLANLLSPYITNNYALVVACAILTFLITTATHKYFVSKNKVAAMFMNGKPLWKE